MNITAGWISGGVGMKKSHKVFYVVSSVFILLLLLGLAFHTQFRPHPNSYDLRILTPTWIYEKFRLQEMADEFMQENPGFVVQIDQYNNYDTSFYPLINKSNQDKYDIFLGASREHIVQYAYSGAIADFEKDFFDEDLRKEDFFPSFLELGNINGRQYMIPLMGEIMALTVRTDLLSKAGLTDRNDVPIPPKDWEELYQYAKKLTTVNANGQKIYGLNIDFGKNMLLYSFYASIQAKKGNIFDNTSSLIDISSSDVKSILEMWQRLVKDGLAPTYTFEDLDAGRENFKHGTVAMLLSAHSRWVEAAADLGKENVGILPLPGADKNGSLTYIHGITIPSNSKQKELAIKFIKQKLLSRRFQSQAMQTYGKIPSLVRNYDTGLSSEWNTIFTWVRDATTLPIYRDWSKIDKFLQVEIQKCVTGQQTPDMTIKNMENQLSPLQSVPR